ncbi:alpha/beta hydrolase [Peribacillus saganii]|nr:alpha/beta hydrolase [Peribacillus saganii]
MKKTIPLLLSMSLAATLFAGCSTSSSEDTAAAKNSSANISNEKPDSTEKSGGGGPEEESIDTSNIKTKYKDVAYGSKSEIQKLDIYLPNEGEGPFPVIVAIHGGGFMKGDKTGADLSPTLEGVNRGYAVVPVNYRLSGEAIFPAAINDVKAAIRYIKKNAKEYNLDPSNIAVWGNSAGGNLAALAGTSGDDNSLNGEKPENPKYSSEVKAVIDWFGPLEFLKLDEQFVESGITPKLGERSSDTSPESKYIGGNITENVEQAEKANPASYITKNDPYFFIQHGTADQNVPTQQSIDFAEKLTNVIGKEKVTLSLIEGAGHGGEQFNSEENLEEVFKFLDSVLK